MKDRTTLRVETNDVDPTHVGVFEVRLLTSGQEIQAGIRMCDLAAGLPLSALPVPIHNLIWQIAYIEQFVVSGPDWFYEHADKGRKMVNLLDMSDTPLIARLYREWADWRGLLFRPGSSNGGGQKTTATGDVEAGKDVGEDD
jgi:hypothetical protein